MNEAPMPIVGEKRSQMLESLSRSYVRNTIVIFQKDGFTEKEILEAFQAEIKNMLGDYQT